MTTKKTEPLCEAPASLNFRGITKGGWDVQFTLRDTSESVLLTRFGDLVKVLEEKYYVTPKGKGNGSTNEKVVPVSQATLPPAEPVRVPDEEQGTQVFDAELLVGSTSGDKVYWKVQGGQFSQFGVTIWPEILEAAGIGDLDPTKTYNLTGYVAYYTLKDNGKPGKVVNLAKP